MQRAQRIIFPSYQKAKNSLTLRSLPFDLAQGRESIERRLCGE